jgi:hypothetical protein
MGISVTNLPAGKTSSPRPYRARFSLRGSMTLAKQAAPTSTPKGIAFNSALILQVIFMTRAKSSMFLIVGSPRSLALTVP